MSTDIDKIVAEAEAWVWLSDAEGYTIVRALLAAVAELREERKRAREALEEIARTLEFYDSNIGQRLFRLAKATLEAGK